MAKDVLFVVDNLVMGGVTKVLENLLNNLNYKKYNVDLLVLHYYEDMKVELPHNVKVINGNKYFSYVDESIKKIVKNKDFKKFFKKLKLVFSLKSGRVKKLITKSRKEILNKNYDVEIAFSDGFSHIFVANGETPNKIAWMHTDISVRNDSKRYYKLVKESLHKMNLCVGVSDKVVDSYREYYNLERLQAIHNIINDEKIKNKADCSIDNIFKNDRISLISVGRVDAQKNYRRLVNIHKKLIDDGYKIQTFIIGDGIEKQELEELVKENKNVDSFKFLGRKDNPFPYVKNADLFVLSSIYEGLPTVLYESIIAGTPCITTDVAGANEILDNKYGVVVENNDEALYIGIKQLLDNKELLNKYKENLKYYKFDKQDIIKKVEKILDN